MESEYEEVAKQTDVALVILRDALWCCKSLGLFWFSVCGCALDTEFKVSHGTDVLIELTAILRAELLGE